jgi:hypothetical protein
MPVAIERHTLMDEQKAAEFLSVKPQTLANWRCTRRYPLAFVKIGRAVRYRLADLEAFIDARTECAVPTAD